LSKESAENADLSRRLMVAVVMPVVLLVATGSVLGLQLLRMSSDAHWLDHSDQVLATTSDLLKQIIDQETGIRGFLITDDRVFLEPFDRAHPGDLLTSLRALVSDNPAQQGRVDEVRRRYERWLSDAATATRGATPGESRSLATMLERKRRMDDIRAAVANLVDAERQLRSERSTAAASSNATTRNFFLGLFLASALALSFVSRRQLTSIASTYATVLAGERLARATVEDEAWVRDGHASVAEQIQGDRTLEDLGERVLKSLASLAGAEVGALFTSEPGGWRRRAGYALDARTAGPETFGLGEGLVGRAAAEREILHLRDVPGAFLKVRSGVGELPPVEVVIVPAVTDGVTHAVVELGFLRPPIARAQELLRRVGESIALAVRSAEYKSRLRDLLDESQRQAEELQTQQEELRVSNEELEEQRNVLRKAHAQLGERKEELESINARLEEQSNELRGTQQEVVEKAAEVSRASRYKSEFLANMSHELRTPLNSSLIMAKLLADNKEGNLTEAQVRFAQTIYSAGNDLLALINDVLDLSKIEAGKIDIRVENLPIARLVSALSRTFEPIARDKKLAFAIRVEEGSPRSIETDPQRLEQILNNLLSNALKFTDSGDVSLRVAPDGNGVSFSVRDTGIGIPKEQQAMVFEAFRQADSASNRKYGGTGLGLSISRDLAHLLRGRIVVESEVGRGSVFTLTVPQRHAEGLPVPAASPPVPSVEQVRPRPPEPSRSVAAAPIVVDDRDHLDRSRPLVLVVEDDVPFAYILRDLAHELDFQCLLAHEADSGIRLATELSPSAIVLDVLLPDHSGLSVLDRLKRNPATRHIPVHIVSVTDHAQAALAMGAVGFLLKPVNRDDLVKAFRKLEARLTRRVRRLLIVEDDATQRESLIQLLGGIDVETRGVGTVSDALAALRETTFDCIVTDLILPGASGFELLERMAEDDAYAFPPVIVYTARSLSAEEEGRLRKHSSSIIVKGARSPERLLDEVTLFLHQVESELPPERRRMLQQARDREAVFEGRRVLVVEDDVRNVFALSSILEPKGATVVIARNGREAIEALERDHAIDLVLMDIMMPEMDGFQAMREIRKRPEWAKLPIIALTAKAMKDDQQRCREAGANDYISKPLNVEMLLSLLRVWMPK
jgi:signal transduction histidine kinase/DNA-binding response OmpR family regulator/CHASE3 domain sensor protein